MTVGSNFSKRANSIRLDMVIHGQIGSLPIAKYTDAHKAFTLTINLLHRVVATFLAESGVLDFDASFANLFLYIVLNRQTVTVPARDIRCIKTT